MIDDYGAEGLVVQLEFNIHDRPYPQESLAWLTPREHACVVNAIEEERAFIHTLDGFAGDSDAMLKKLTAYLDGSAALSKSALFSGTAHRAQMALYSVYTVNGIAKKPIEMVVDCFEQISHQQERLVEREFLNSPVRQSPSHWLH